MAFEGLSEKLSVAFKKLRGKGRLTEADVKEAMREIRLALLEADVSYKVVKQFIAQVTERAVGSDVLEALSPAQTIIKIVNEELTALMGGTSTKLEISSKPPTVVMLVGLQGAGKTTNGAKLAGLMKRQNGKRPLLAACDIYRPAAIKQLEVVGGQLDIPVFHDRMVPQLLDKRGQHLRKGDGTVLAARAPHSDGKLAFALFHIERQCVSYKVLHALQQAVRLLKLHDIFHNLFVQAGFVFQLRDIKRVGQAADVKYDIRLFGLAVFEAEGDDVQHHPLLFFLQQQAADALLVLGGGEQGRVDGIVGPHPQRLQDLTFLQKCLAGGKPLIRHFIQRRQNLPFLQNGFIRGYLRRDADGMATARFLVPPLQHIVARVQKQYFIVHPPGFQLAKRI